MVKLNAEIIQSSHQYTNTIKERELDLRGKDTGIFWQGNDKHEDLLSLSTKHLSQKNIKAMTPNKPSDTFTILVSGYKIPVIENLGATLVSFLDKLLNV